MDRTLPVPNFATANFARALSVVQRFPQEIGKCRRLSEFFDYDRIFSHVDGFAESQKG